MSKMHAWTLAVTLLLASCVTTPPSSRPEPQPQPKAQDLSGNWVLTTKSRMGTEDAQMTVRHSGDALMGTITGQAGTVDYTGSVNGSAVAFDFTMKVHGADLKLDYAGTVQGDTMQGKAVFGQFGEGTFTARRRQ